MRLLTLNRGPIVRDVVGIKCPFKGYLFFVETVQDTLHVFFPIQAYLICTAVSEL